MTLHELNDEQRLQLKQSLLCERQESVSQGELVMADELITDEDLEKAYSATEFVEGDFI